jgi:outer membrane protein
MLKFAVVLFAGLLAFGAAEAQQISIGVINSQRILAEAPQMKAASARLKQEFEKRETEVQDLENRINGMQAKYEKDAPLMTEADRAKSSRDLGELAKDYQRRKRELQEDFNQRRNEEYDNALSKVKKVVTQVAEENKFDLVLQDTSVAYSSSRIDITEKVLKALNK